MIGLPATIRVLVSAGAGDLRRGFDGLARLSRDVIGEDGLSGALFVFRNRRGTG
jgi:transposase